MDHFVRQSFTFSLYGCKIGTEIDVLTWNLLCQCFALFSCVTYIAPVRKVNVSAYSKYTKHMQQLFVSVIYI